MYRPYGYLPSLENLDWFRPAPGSPWGVTVKEVTSVIQKKAKYPVLALHLRIESDWLLGFCGLQ